MLQIKPQHMELLRIVQKHPGENYYRIFKLRDQNPGQPRSAWNTKSMLNTLVKHDYLVCETDSLYLRTLYKQYAFPSIDYKVRYCLHHLCKVLLDLHSKERFHLMTLIATRPDSTAYSLWKACRASDIAEFAPNISVAYIQVILDYFLRTGLVYTKIVKRPKTPKGAIIYNAAVSLRTAKADIERELTL